ncbi:hypothetical protein niasHT_026552 [Heterodera trifolii]|uniref:RING-type domain-containing protein n=1 Tax=Heterodera trifolii TaxID=157864 RepID=A0ABD2KSS7_9BILA
MLHKMAFLTAARLKLRINHEAVNPARKFRVDLEITITKNGQGHQYFHKDVKTGKNMQIRIPRKSERDKYELCLHIYTNPIDDEFVPDQSDQNPSDDQPYEEAENNIELEDIRQMFKCVEMKLYAPVPSRRYLINLGSFEPRGIWWNRRIFINSNNDFGNYHAFLYAKFSEYVFSIPVDLTPFFKHKIWYNELLIYRYEESKYLIDSPNGQNKETPPTEDIDNELNCSICLEAMIEGENIIKLHGEKDNDKASHIFHNECIKKWFKTHGNFRCPLCNRELKLEMRAFLPSLFTDVANSYQNMHMDSVGELVRIANGDNGTQFEQKQAEKEMESFLRVLKESEETLRESLAQIELDHLVPNSAEKLVEFKDGKIIESPSLENIQKQTEQFVSNGQHSQEVIVLPYEVLLTP